MQDQKATLEALAAKFNLEKGLINNLLKAEPAVRAKFFEVVKWSGLTEGQKKIGNMLSSLATKMTVTIDNYRQTLSEFVGKGQISNPNQLDYIIEYLKNWQAKGGVDLEKMKTDCGIGIILTNQQLEAIILEQIATANQKSKKFEFLAKIKEKIPYVEGKLLKDLFERIWKEKGLPENVVTEKEKKEKKPKEEGGQQVEAKVQAQEEVFHIKDITQLIGREMKSAVNSKQLIEKRNAEFGPGVLTRFPPEPNGYLHIGHCKAMRFNFKQAQMSNGSCYLRFDDTNPTKQNTQYIINIKENIQFMGYTPFKITHASDNFEKLYQFAVQLIKQGDAFACSETMEEMRRKRGEGIPSPFRDRSVEENLKIFEQMRLGLYEEGEMSLRARIDHKHANTTLRDPVIYRIKFHSHPHVGDKWCIYPMYDYAHPICDSLQGISHSLCSLQFEIRRQLYYWFLDRLNLFKPSVWEYSRLNITYTVMSKRKLHELIFTNRVNGWDDPRILTINGLRRRGYPAQALNNFCDALGVTRRGNQNYINFGVLQHQVRKYLDTKAPRTMAVLDPVQMIIEGLQEQQNFSVALFPKDQQRGTRNIRFSRRIWVERSDIKLVDEKGFFGIAPNKVIGLKYANSFYVKEVRAENGVVVSVVAEVDQKKRKPNSYLSWLSADEAADCTIVNFGLLFDSQKPADDDNYLNSLNHNSREEYKNAKIHQNLLKEVKFGEHYQFERKGFYCLDKDSNLQERRLVWNQTVGLVDRLKK